MTLKELYEKRANVLYQMKNTYSEAEKADNSLDADKLKQWDSWDSEFNDLTEQIQRMEKFEKTMAQNAEPIEKSEPQTKKEDPAKKNRSAFEDYIMNGMGEMNPENKEFARATGNLGRIQDRAPASSQSTTGQYGGYTIPEELMKRVISAQEWYGGLLDRSLCTWLSTKSGNDIKIPNVDDTSNLGYFIGSATDLNASATALSGMEQTTLGAYKFTSGLLKVDNELIQDSAINFAEWLVDKLIERYNRGMNYQLTLADSSYNDGITTLTTKGEDAAASTITRTDILNLLHSVDKAYRTNGKFMFNDSTLKSIKALVQSSTYNNSPLWQVSIREGEPDRLEGKPYLINNDMADLGTSTISVLFGDFSYFYIREALPMKVIRLAERFADTDQTAFVVLGRFDSKLPVASGTAPIKHILNAAS